MVRSTVLLVLSFWLRTGPWMGAWFGYNDDNDATDAAFHPPMLFIIRLHQVWRWGGKDQLWLQAASQICHLNGWTKVSCLSPIKTNCYIKRGEHPKVLESAYLSCLNLMKEHNLRSIAFPCISTGVYGYPQVASICQHIILKKINVGLF